MSLFSTIAHPGARGFSRMGAGMIAVALVVGFATGIAVPVDRPVGDADEAAATVQTGVTGQAHDAYIRLKANDVRSLSPTGSDGQQSDPRMQWFLEWNIDRLEYQSVEPAAKATGLR